MPAVSKLLTRTGLRKQLEAELRGKRSVRLNLYHAPGAGGSTVAKRLLWDFHHSYPCVLLRHSDPQATADRLYKIAGLTGHSVLVMLDGAQVTERQADDLFDQVRARQIPAVLLQVLRRFKQQTEHRRTFYLESTLTPGEAQRFVEVFSRERPDRRRRLEGLKTQGPPRLRTAFYFGLETFGKDFRGLESYVKALTRDLTPDQTRILTFVALAHHYAQRSINRAAFSAMVGIKDRNLSLAKVFPHAACELLIEDENGGWRTSHDLVAVEIIEQMLSPIGSDRRNWPQYLSSWAIEFAHFCRGDGSVASDELQELLTRAFIFRDNTELLGTERSASRTLSQMLEDIPSREGRLTVLKELTSLYPEEPHFWAHLGRFYTLAPADFRRALECIDRAISFSPEDHVLFHMRGMAIRAQISEALRTGAAVDVDMVELMKAAAGAFRQARELQPEDEHAYISEVQMIARVLDQFSKEEAVRDGQLSDRLLRPGTDPYVRDAFQNAESLLEQVRRNREGEGASTYEEDCRAKLDALYGRHERALQAWDSLLGRADTYRPPVRRQIVWTYLARKDRAWSALTQREISRIVELLEDNLEEEANNDSNLRLWVQAVRKQSSPPPLEAIIEKVGYWKTNSGSLDSVYYLYVLYTLDALEGSPSSRESALKFVGECKALARSRRNRTKSLEWLGTGNGISKLVHHSELGKWDEKDKDYWEAPSKLTRVRGRISRIEGNQAGLIEIAGRLEAFFVPVREGFHRDRSENTLVDFNLGFSYDGLRAWDVKATA